MALGKRLTPYRREVLERFRDLGPVTIAEATDGHQNNIPTLIDCGWVKHLDGDDYWSARYEITDAGRAALAAD